MDNGLTQTERQVYNLLIQGLDIRTIANTLFVCDETIKFHSTNIYKKCNVKSKAELIVKHFKYGDNMNNNQNTNLPTSSAHNELVKRDNVKYIVDLFKIEETLSHLHTMMKEVCKHEVTANNVMAACTCVVRKNETIQTAIQAAKFINGQ